jgi:hypothetical protein
MLTEDHGTANKDEFSRCQGAGGEMRTQTFLSPLFFPFCCISRAKVVGKPRLYPGGLLVTRSKKKNSIFFYNIFF